MNALKASGSSGCVGPGGEGVGVGDGAAGVPGFGCGRLRAEVGRSGPAFGGDVDGLAGAGAVAEGDWLGDALGLALAEGAGRGVHV